MDQSPSAIDPVRQERRILIFRLHDHAITFEGMEILCERQSYARPSACVRSISDGILVHFRNIGNARIFYAPQFIGIAFRVSLESGLGVNLPVVNAICGARRT